MSSSPAQQTGLADEIEYESDILNPDWTKLACSQSASGFGWNGNLPAR